MYLHFTQTNTNINISKFSVSIHVTFTIKNLFLVKRECDNYMFFCHMILFFVILLLLYLSMGQRYGYSRFLKRSKTLEPTVVVTLKSITGGHTHFISGIKLAF